MRDKVFEISISCRVRVFNGVAVLFFDRKEFELSEVAYSVYKLIDGNKKVVQIVSILLEEYDIDRQILERDIFELIEEWASLGIVEIFV